jgi:hypothetical protein
MQSSNSLDFPALIRPKLTGGRIHRLVIDDMGITAATIDGFFGNTVSMPILRIPRDALIEAQYLPRRLRGDRCQVRYRDLEKREQQLTFVAVHPDAMVTYSITALAAQVLEDIRSGKVNSEPIRFDYSLAPVRPLVKLLIVPIAFAAVIVCPNIVRFGSASIVVTLWFVGLAICAGLAATAIDHVRIHTGWHPVAKITASVAALVGAFCLVAILLGLLDYYDAR